MSNSVFSFQRCMFSGCMDFSFFVTIVAFVAMFLFLQNVPYHQEIFVMALNLVDSRKTRIIQLPAVHACSFVATRRWMSPVHNTTTNFALILHVSCKLRNLRCKHRWFRPVSDSLIFVFNIGVNFAYSYDQIQSLTQQVCHWTHIVYDPCST